jgi:O-antigen/teichoic acid export membrane protein
MAGRTAGFVALFAIPLVLARAFTPAEFGLYKQVFLLYTTAFSMAQLGMAESLYFFVPTDPERAGRAAANAVAILIAVGIVAGTVLCLMAPAIARGMGSPGLAHYVPALAIFLGLTLPAASLEILMVARRNYATSAVVYAASDVTRATMLATPALAGGGLGAVLTGAIVFAISRCVALGVYVWREFGSAFRLDRGVLWAQARYALPFAGAVTLDVAQNNWHQYVVSSSFDPATFAIYSVGCLQIPLVDLLSTSAANVMMVTMGCSLADRACQLSSWYETVDRLAVLLLPLACILGLLAQDVIVTLFTTKYVASAPVFMVTAVTIALAAFPVDAVLRVHAQTRFLFFLNLFRLVVIATTIGWFLRRFGLPGAALVSVVATATSKMVAIRRIARILQVRIRAVLPWKHLAGIAGTAAGALIPASLVRSHLHMSPMLAGLVTGIVYSAIYGGVVGGWWLATHAGSWSSLGLSRAGRPSGVL